MHELKPLSKDAVPSALEKAHHYRLLNEPREAESICLDILEVDPGHEDALICLILSISDQLDRRQVEHVRPYLDRLKDEYHRHYYKGLLCERAAKTVIEQLRPRYQYDAYEWLREAMEHYDAAEKIKPPGNEESILRWNTCVRMLQRRPELQAESAHDHTEHMLE